MNKELAFSVTIKDCEVQTFRSGGKGGQNQNKRDTGVRIIHHPSGAIGESREERSQLQNKKNAFAKMANTVQFKTWVSAMLTKTKTPKQLEEEVDQELSDSRTIKVEHKNENGKWIEGDVE